MPVNRSLEFRSPARNEAQPPMLEKIISEYRNIVSLNVGDVTVFEANFDAIGRLEAFYAVNWIYLKENSLAHNSFIHIPELLPLYLSDGLIHKFVGNGVREKENKVRMVLPPYYADTGRIVAFDVDKGFTIEQYTKSTLNTFANLKAVYRTSAEVLNKLVK